MKKEAAARLDGTAVMDRAIRRFARIDVELLQKRPEPKPGALVADADSDRSILVVDAHGDDRALESRVGHSRHCEEELSGQERTHGCHDAAAEQQRQGPRQSIRRRPRSLESSTPAAYLGCSIPRRVSMPIQPGDKIPDVPITIATDDGPKPTTTGEYFKDKKVALFAVPGAFTPTCSARHLPSYVEKAGELKGKGIDEVACISVNDAFVMGAWGKADGSPEITMLADGNGEFADAVGLTMDGSKFGMGKRSQRYSMVIDGGVVEQLNVEAPGEYRASSAEHMLEQL
jgi:peroxiredoxin